MVDIRQDKRWGDYVISRGWGRDFVKSADGKTKLQVLIVKFLWFPFRWLKLQRNDKDPDFEDLQRVIKKNRVFHSIIEPIKIENKENYEKYGFKRNSSPFLPLKTVIIDLNKSESELWGELSENAKRLIKRNNQIKIEKCDPDDFFRYWKKYAKVWTLSRGNLEKLVKAFGNDVRVEIAKDDRGVHSGIIFIDTKDTTNYYITWTSDLGRKSGGHFKFVWESIMEAKQNGKKFYDFEGIYDPEYPIRNWEGFTEFKLKFCPQATKFPGSFYKWF